MNQYEHYQIISYDHELDLLERVNNMIKDGWLPAGGIFIRNGRTYSQAMWNPPLPEEIKNCMSKFDKKEAIKK